METLLASYSPHLMTVGVIHALLITAVGYAHCSYGSTPWFLPKGWCRQFYQLFPVGGIYGSASVLIGVAILSRDAITFMLFNAALITVMFLELSIVLGRNFFRNMFNDDLPFSITMMVSFVLGINGGYFTLMFILKLFRPLLNPLNTLFTAPLDTWHGPRYAASIPRHGRRPCRSPA